MILAPWLECWRCVNLRSLVGSTDFHNTVGVDLEGDLDLRDTTGGRRDARELEFTEKVVVLCQRTLSFEDLDQYSGLIIRSGGEASGWHVSIRQIGGKTEQLTSETCA